MIVIHYNETNEVSEVLHYGILIESKERERVGFGRSPICLV